MTRVRLYLLHDIVGLVTSPFSLFGAVVLRVGT